MENSSKFNKTNREIFEFYKDKDPSLPITQKYLNKGWVKEEKALYIKYARCCKNGGKIEGEYLEKEDHITNYHRIKKYLQNGDFSSKFVNLSYMEDLIDIKEINIKEGKPSQKWHLYGSYFAQCVVEDNKNKKKFQWTNNFKKSIRCRELRLWMAEAAGIDLVTISKEVDKDNEIATNKLIDEHCSWDKIFERIKIQKDNSDA